LEELLSDQKGYKPQNWTEQRKYHKVCEKIYNKARDAYVVVRRQFKENSPAESCVTKADPSRKLNILCKMFLAKQDNQMSMAGAVRLVKS
jgi:hypothetical protein